MPNGFTDRQIEELNRAAAEFIRDHDESAAIPLPSMAMREAQGELVFLFEKVEAYLSKLQPTNREDKRTHGARYKALSGTWNDLKKAALRQAKSR